MIFKKKRKIDECFKFNANNLRNITSKAKDDRFKKSQSQYLENLKKLITNTAKNGERYYFYTDEVNFFDYLTNDFMEYLETYFKENEFVVERKKSIGDLYYLKISWE